MTEAPRDWEEQISEIMSAIEDLREQLDEIRAPRDWQKEHNWELVERAVDQGGFYSTEDVHDLISTASIMQSGTNSVAIVDWTTVRNSCLLLEGVEPGEFTTMRLDPFLAFADLAALVGAAVFYDRVVVLSDLDWAWRANRALGLQDRPVVGIRSTTNASGGLDNVLTAAWSMALGDLNKAEEQQLSWIDWLRTSWNNLLPSTPFPSHGEGNYETRMGYGGQYNDSATDARKDLVDLFRQSGDAWQLREDNLDKVILDNDLRALFYEYLATSLTQALSSTGRPIQVNYVGGCLRSPLLLARARYAEACLNTNLTVEGWLYTKWKEVYTPMDVDLEMPFWLHAAMASSSDAG